MSAYTSCGQAPCHADVTNGRGWLPSRSGRFIPVKEVHNSPYTGLRPAGEFVATRNMRAAARIRTLGRPASKYVIDISAFNSDAAGSTGNASRQLYGLNFGLDTDHTD